MLLFETTLPRTTVLNVKGDVGITSCRILHGIAVVVEKAGVEGHLLL